MPVSDATLSDVADEAAGALRHRLTVAEQAVHRDVHVAELAGHPCSTAHDRTRFDHAAAETCADDRRYRRPPQRLLPVVGVVGVQRSSVAVVAVHHRDAEPGLERRRTSNPHHSGRAKLVAPLDEITPSAEAGPGVSRPTARTSARSMPVICSALSNAAASASSAGAVPSVTLLGTSTMRSIRNCQRSSSTGDVVLRSAVVDADDHGPRVAHSPPFSGDDRHRRILPRPSDEKLEDEHGKVATMIDRLRGRQEWQFFRALRRAAPAYAIGWWVLVVLRGTLPAVTSIAFGWLVSAITRHVSLVGPLVMVGVSFSLLLISQPLHQVVSANLGGRMAAHLYDRLISICVAPAGIAHLERSELTTDLTMARDFDLGMMGPPLEISMDFIAGGLVDLVVGVSAAILLAAFHWWAALLLAVAWLSTHWLLRESGVWKDRNTDEVRKAQRHAEYSYRLAVDAAPAKELRFFGLAGWVTDRFVSTRRRLYQLQYEATRLREKSVLSCLAIVLAANVVVFWAVRHAADRRIDPLWSCSCRLRSVSRRSPSAD